MAVIAKGKSMLQLQLLDELEQRDVSASPLLFLYFAPVWLKSTLFTTRLLYFTPHFFYSVLPLVIRCTWRR